MVRTFSRMSGSGRDALPVVRAGREAHSDVREIGRPSRMSESGRDALLDVREWSGGPTGYPEVVGTPSQMSESGRESLQAVWEW